MSVPSSTETEPWWERYDYALEIGSSVVGGTVVAVLGAIAHSYFGPKEQLCNSGLGQLAQQQDNGALFGCGADSLIAQGSQVAFWGGMVVALLGVVAAVLVVVVLAGEKRGAG